MKISFTHSGSSVASMKELVSKYSRKEFASPQRSTVPSVAFWMDTERRVVELCSQLKLIFPDEVNIEFEYKVRPPSGRGKESHTDVMLWWNSTCIGIEAKYTEPPYEDVSTWLNAGANPENRFKVLNGWCGLIAKVTGKQCDPESLGMHTYQMIHRIASVCSRPEQKKHVFYQVFNPQSGKVEYYRRELSNLKQIFGIGSAVQLHLSKVAVISSDLHSKLVQKWNSDGKSCSSEIVAGLVAGDLISFGNVEHETI